MMKKIFFLIPILAFFGIFLFYNDSYATNCIDSLATMKMDDTTREMFAQNNILFYEPCTSQSGGMNSSFKVDSSVNPWYPEGDILRTYVGGQGTAYIGKNRNAEAFNSTQEDDSLDGMQYIYAEQFDITWNGSVPTFTKNSSNSTTKYYWVVLPDKAYNNAVGETYLATFEKLSEPIHFIVMDTHACIHQHDPNYCDEAAANPEGVVARQNFLGAFTSHNGNSTTLYEVTGGLTGFHRLTGESEILASESGSGTDLAATCSSGFKFYAQFDSQWGNEPYGSCGGDTIANSGCGPTSFAMMATMLLGKEILPSETTKVAGDAGMNVCGAGSSHDITRVLAEHYGLQYEKVDASSTQDAIDKISQRLKDGWMIHTSNGCHYIGIRGITDSGKWLLADSATSEEKNQQEYDPQDVMSGSVLGGTCKTEINIGNLHAIKGDGSAACSDSCTQDDGGLQSGGFKTLEEAKNFMKSYRERASQKEHGTITFEDAVVSLDFCGDGTLNNCSSFTQWFINKYTSLGPNGSPTSGMNGDQVVSTLLGANLGFEDGGSTPKAWAIMSKTPQHTGVVLGVDTDNDKIFIGEANCDGYDSDGGTWPDAHEYSLSQYSGSSFKYAYTDKILKGVSK